MAKPQPKPARDEGLDHALSDLNSASNLLQAAIYYMEGTTSCGMQGQECESLLEVLYCASDKLEEGRQLKGIEP